MSSVIVYFNWICSMFKYTLTNTFAQMFSSSIAIIFQLNLRPLIRIAFSKHFQHVFDSFSIKHSIYFKKVLESINKYWKRFQTVKFSFGSISFLRCDFQNSHKKYETLLNFNDFMHERQSHSSTWKIATSIQKKNS